ncbi:MAG: GntR family transcriptional regulator, partial [Pseudomonadota bacterium]
MSQMAHQSLAPAAPVGASEDGQDSSSELGAQAYRRLKSDILKCVLAPGTVVTEQQAAERYGLGKGPIRSALLRLRHEGLVISE